MKKFGQGFVLCSEIGLKMKNFCVILLTNIMELFGSTNTTFPLLILCTFLVLPPGSIKQTQSVLVTFDVAESQPLIGL